MSAWPRAPRRVPVRVALATWWHFAVIALAALCFAVFGALYEWSRDDFRSPRDDWRLDASDCAVALGTVVAIDHGTGRHGRRNHHARYSFAFADAAGLAHTGQCWRVQDTLANGSHHGVEYLADAPTVCRLRDGKVAYAALWLPWYAGAVLLPTLLACGLWLARAFRTYVLVRHGHATAAVLVASSKVPAGRRRQRLRHLRVAFRFVDDAGKQQQGHQHARLTTPLAAAIAATTPGQPIAAAFVVFASHDSRHCRLVATADVSEASA